MNKRIEDYLALPYTIEMVADTEGGWVVTVKELPGCISQGDSPQEAMDMIMDAMRGWIEVALEDGCPVPEPRALDDYSGRFVVRVPRSLHRDLAKAAGDEGVSLNQLINVALAQYVGISTKQATNKRRNPAKHPSTMPISSLQKTDMPEPKVAPSC